MKGIAVVFIVLITVGIVFILNSQARIDSYYRNCVDAGGHIYKPDGTSFCISDDGRWLEVYP